MIQHQNIVGDLDKCIMVVYLVVYIANLVVYIVNLSVYIVAGFVYIAILLASRDQNTRC